MTFAELVLLARTDSLKQGAKDLDALGAASGRAEKSTGKATSAMNKGFALAAKSALGLGAAMLATFGAGAVLQGIAKFDEATARLGAISRATTAEMHDMRAMAQSLGASTEFSATQAAEALTFLSMAGFDARESLASIPAVLDLATASGMGLAAAADTASNIMSGFGIAATEAAAVTDILAAASTRANTNVSQLGSAMSTVAPIAAALDIGIQDTAAAIGVLSDAGIQGERAGTALRGVLAALAGPTDAATDALGRYGLQASDVDVATRSLADVMATLAGAGLSTADAMEIFGREAASGALVMVGAADRVREFGAELRDVDGAASSMASQIRDNLNGDLQGLGSAASGLIIALGDAGLTAVFRALTQALTSVLRGTAAVVGVLAELTRLAVDGVGSWLGWSSGADTAAVAASDAALNTAELNTALRVFATSAAPDAAASAIDIANANIKLAKSALDAAEAEVAKRRALAERSDGRMDRGRQAELASALADVEEAQARIDQARRDQLRAAQQVAGSMSAVMTREATETKELAVEVDVLTSNLSGAATSADVVDGAVTQLSESLAGPMNSAVESVSDAWADFVVTGLDDFEGFAESVLSSFKSMLSQMISTAASNSINISMGVSGSGTAGVASSLLGGGFNPLGLVSGGGVGSIGSMLAGTIGGGGLLAGTTFGAGLSATLTGGLMGSAGAIGAGAGMGGLAGLGMAAGAAAPWLIGGALALNSLGAFGGKTEVTDQGLQGSFGYGSAGVQSYTNTHKDGGWFKSDKNRTNIAAADAGLTSYVTQSAAALQQASVSAAATLGIGAQAFSGFSSSFKVSVKDLTGEQAMAAVNQELANMGDAFAGVLPQFSSMAELLTAASERVELTDRLLALQGKDAELLARQRERELAATHDANKATLMQIYALEDQAAALEASADAVDGLSAAASKAAQAAAEEEQRLNDQFRSDTMSSSLFATSADREYAASSYGLQSSIPESAGTPALLAEIVRAVREGNINNSRRLTDLLRLQERAQLEPAA